VSLQRQQPQEREIKPRETPAIKAMEHGLMPEQIATYQATLTLMAEYSPGITPFQRAWMARVAATLNLDILLGELMWYQNRPYVPIAGVLTIIKRNPAYEVLELDPAGPELRQLMRVADQEEVWVCKLWHKDRAKPFVGYGRASPADTHAGYGRLSQDDPRGPVATKAVHEQAQERAIRHAARIAGFDSGLTSTLEEPASPAHKRVDPSTGAVSAVLEDGTPNVVGCSASQRAAIHALAAALKLPEGAFDTVTEEVLHDGWRADMYRLFGKTSTMQLTVAEAQLFIDSLKKLPQEVPNTPEEPSTMSQDAVMATSALSEEEIPEPPTERLASVLRGIPSEIVADAVRLAASADAGAEPAVDDAGGEEAAIEMLEEAEAVRQEPAPHQAPDKKPDQVPVFTDVDVLNEMLAWGYKQPSRDLPNVLGVSLADWLAAGHSHRDAIQKIMKGAIDQKRQRKA